MTQGSGNQGLDSSPTADHPDSELCSASSHAYCLEGDLGLEAGFLLAAISHSPHHSLTTDGGNVIRPDSADGARDAGPTSRSALRLAESAARVMEETIKWSK